MIMIYVWRVVFITAGRTSLATSVSQNQETDLSHQRIAIMVKPFDLAPHLRSLSFWLLFFNPLQFVDNEISKNLAIV